MPNPLPELESLEKGLGHRRLKRTVWVILIHRWESEPLTDYNPLHFQKFYLYLSILYLFSPTKLPFKKIRLAVSCFFFKNILFVYF